jgi:hypothetical protein
MTADKPEKIPGKRKKAGGRQKGTPNKITRTIREAIIQSFDSVGGANYLQKIAVQEPAAYLQLLAKVLPTQITGADDAALIPDGFVVEVISSGSPKATKR